MGKLNRIVEAMRTSPAWVRYADLFKVCEHYFGEARQSGSSHAVFRTPWHGDPRVNIQNDHGKAKAYQVRQVLAAIAKLEEAQDTAEMATDTEQGKEKKP
ncbi:toxin HicA [Promicromonospora sp. CA-289599]|uniref:toxin HicA n=1 Tax=Promicromonospora sp. CA-289599 TaxID=3240014 RepID=UPI003D8FE3F2